MSVSVYFSQQQQQKCCVYLNLNRLFKIRKPEIRHLCIKLKYNVKIIIIIIIIIIICTATAVSSVAIRGLIPKSRCGQWIEVQNQKWRCRLLHSVTRIGRQSTIFSVYIQVTRLNIKVTAKLSSEPV